MSGTLGREYLRKIRGRYRKGDRMEKGRILDEFCKVCGYARKYAIRVLNSSEKGKGDTKKRGPRVRYGAEVVAVLERIWLATDQVCSKRLKAAIPLWLAHYEKRYGDLPEATRTKILTLSPATMDRLLSPVRLKRRPMGIGGTRPSTWLRNQIPIRTSCGTSGGPDIWRRTRWPIAGIPWRGILCGASHLPIFTAVGRKIGRPGIGGRKAF